MAPSEMLARTPPDYFPPAAGRYEIKPGLVRFGRPLGGGEADGHVFQIDSTFPVYHRAKLAARTERLSKYFQTDRFDQHAAPAINKFVVRRFLSGDPHYFARDDDRLNCALTGDHVRLEPDSVNTFDALAMQVQEDLAVVRVDGDRHWLSAVHLSFP